MCWQLVPLVLLLRGCVLLLCWLLLHVLGPKTCDHAPHGGCQSLLELLPGEEQLLHLLVALTSG